MIEIAEGHEHELGLASYFDPQLGKPTRLRRQIRVAATGQSARVDRVLAGQIRNGQRLLLVDWEGHTQPTWIIDDGSLDHTLSFEGLLGDVADDADEFQREVGPGNYGMRVGDLHPLHCCAACKAHHTDGREYGVLIDASRHGNVRVLPIFAILSLTYNQSLRGLL